MHELTQLFSHCVSVRKAKDTQRRIIILKDPEGYRLCLSHLKLAGIRPAKKLPLFHAVSCYFQKEANISALENHPAIKRIEQDVRVYATEAVVAATAAQIPWGVERIHAPRAWVKSQGQGIRVAVLDTGISAHPDLRIAGQYNALSNKRAVDLNGHGTHVAGTIAARRNSFGVVGVAPQVNLYNVKVLSKSGSGYTSDVIEGITWCIQNNIQVINMSFGMSQNAGILHEAIKRAYRRGIVMVAAAGNGGINANGIQYPARYEETISVAASTEENRIASFSSRGTGVDVAAPGVDIMSTYLHKQYKTLSGTSMAVPHVTGAAALLLARFPGLSPAAVKQRLQRFAHRIPGYSTLAQGRGIIDIFRAI